MVEEHDGMDDVVDLEASSCNEQQEACEPSETQRRQQLNAKIVVFETDSMRDLSESAVARGGRQPAVE